jgi:hypothetical protein
VTAALEALEQRVAQAARAAELAAWRIDVRGARADGADAAAGAALLALAHEPEVELTLRAGAADGDRRAQMLSARLERVRLSAGVAWLPSARASAAEEASWLACLREDPSRERREAAWRRRVAAAAHAGEAIVASAAARRRLGTSGASYAARLLRANELSEAEVEALLAAEDTRTQEAWQKARAAREAALGLASGTLAPWDLHAWPGHASVSEMLSGRSGWQMQAAWARAWGFDDAPLANVPVDEPAAGGASATTYFIDAPHDVRVVAEDPCGEWSGWVRLGHELGHVLYARGHDPLLPWSLRDAPAPWLHEAVAQRFAGHTMTPTPGRGFAEPVAFERALASRLRLVHASFERDLHDVTVPLGALTARWWAAMRRFLGVDDPAGAASWARVTHFASRPGSGAVYLAAEAAAVRLRGSAEVLRTQIFWPGATNDAATTLRQAMRY